MPGTTNTTDMATVFQRAYTKLEPTIWAVLCDSNKLHHSPSHQHNQLPPEYPKGCAVNKWIYIFKTELNYPLPWKHLLPIVFPIRANGAKQSFRTIFDSSLFLGLSILNPYLSSLVIFSAPITTVTVICWLQSCLAVLLTETALLVPWLTSPSPILSHLAPMHFPVLDYFSWIRCLKKERDESRREGYLMLRLNLTCLLSSTFMLLNNYLSLHNYRNVCI